jgi:N-acylneuraminate cytidylyltransferase
VTEILALIPARGGSKGLPRKNVMPLAGKPLIAYTIATALESATITRTIVSTDDDEIADAARGHGAEVPFMRPPQLAADESLDLEVFQHALAWLSREESYQPDLVVHLRPTNPIRRTERIDEAVRAMLADPEADSLRSVSVPAQTPYKMWRREGAYLAPLVEVEGVRDAHSRPRQSLPEVWWQNGYVDVIRPRTMLELASMSGERVLPFVVQDRFVEIDYADAFAAAEELLRRREAGDDERDPEAKYPA